MRAVVRGTWVSLAVLALCLSPAICHAARVLSASPTSANFGFVAVKTTARLPVIVTNSGTTSVKIQGVAVQGSSAFTVSGWSGSVSLAPSYSLQLTVAFNPAAGQSYSGTLAITANGTSLQVPLSGTGSAGSTSASLSVSPAAVSFGSVTVGTTATQTATLAASGSSVTVSSATVSGSGFSLSGIQFPVTIAAGQSVPFTLTFSPQTSGSASGSVSFGSNASNSLTQTLSGSGTAPVQHKVSLSWTPSTSTVAGYNIYRSMQASGPYTKVNAATTANTGYDDSTVQAGSTYYYVTTAVDNSGTESGYSNQVKVVIPSP